MERKIVVTSADGLPYIIEFHRTADRCWRLTVSGNQHVLYEPVNGDKVSREEFGYVIESTSLERLMAFITEQILKTEF
jgi:hypothetical protein